MTASANRVLVIGVLPEVNRGVVAELTALGISAVGTTDVQGATSYHAGDFEVIAMGGGVDPATRAELRKSFEAQSTSVRVIDTFAPIAARHIASALRRSPDAEGFASAFSVEDGGEKLIARVTVRRDCELRLDAYAGPSPWKVTRVAASSVSPGSPVLEIEKELVRDALMLVLTLNDEEYHLHRLGAPPAPPAR